MRPSSSARWPGHQLVVVENLLTIPMNLPASRVAAQVLRGRPALLHHHDPPWHRARFAHITELPVDDPAWRHVAISHLAAAELAERGFQADVVYNALDVDTPPGDGAARAGAARRRPGAPAAPPPGTGDRTQGRPHRARARPPPSEARTGCPARPRRATDRRSNACSPRRRSPFAANLFVHADRADVYAAADAVLYPSTWEGFGIPPLEAAVFGRPVVVGRLPGGRRAARARLPLAARLTTRSRCDAPCPTRGSMDDDLAHNRSVVRRWFSLDRLRDTLADLLARAGWAP